MRKQELHPRTAVINKKQKNQSKKARMDALMWLAATFPQSFDNTIRIRPLKKGIMNDIMLHAEEADKAGISKSKLREAVVIFTRRLDYLACLKTKEMRVDLQGENVEPVSAEEAEYAAGKIKKKIEKSVKNARKTMAEKSLNKGLSTGKGLTKPSGLRSFSSHEDNLPIYPARAPQIPVVQKTAAVVIKHKTTRAYDPDAVARLKEKLGLSRNKEENKEVV